MSRTTTLTLPASSCTLALIALASSCTPFLQVITYEPGRIEPRGARALVLVDGEGRASAKRLATHFVDIEAAGGWWRVDDRSSSGIKLQLNGDKGEVVGGSTTPRPDELWVRVDVVQWNVEDTTIDDEDDEGNAISIPATKAEVVLQCSVVAPDGKILMREQEYAYDVVLAKDVVLLGDPLEQATREAASLFVDDITPRRKAWTLRIDDTDPRIAKLPEAVAKGELQLREAERQLRRYLKRNPTSAIALYDLAVVLDAQGKHDDAIAKYEEAMKINARDYYAPARDGAKQRANARRAVYGEPRPAPKMEEPPAPLEKQSGPDAGEPPPPPA